MSFDLPILVVGAGPAGLTAALALSQRGIDVAVVDAAGATDPRMRASTFHPPTLDMLAGLGVVETLLDQGEKVRHWQMRQHESGEYVSFDLATIADRTAYPFRLQLPQQVLCTEILKRLEADGVPVYYNAAATRLRQRDDEVVTTINGVGDFRSSFVIGADGAGGATRSAIGLEYGGKTYTHASVLVSTTFPFDEHLADLAGVAYTWSSRGPYALLRQPDLWRASLYPAVESLEEAASEDKVRDWFAYIAPGAENAEITDISPYRVHERCVDRFRVGRVALAGDAAHLNPPSGGMGMNGGVHDAINLADTLAEIRDGADIDLLDRYSRQRHHAASTAIIPQASQRRRGMMIIDRDMQLERLAEYRSVNEDPARLREFLLKSSMVTGLDEARDVE